jgi:putative spermidine/putrescine transport system ATP-binding protein
MLGLKIETVSKSFGPFKALDRVSLQIPQGQFICFLGPSGCGKTSLLRLIAGLEQPTSGRILLNDKDITPIPANGRGFGMVFQSLALFPHLTVEQNIAYSLRLKGRDRKQQADRVEELLALIRLPGLGKRQIGQLSGGQRQRVAIARALAQEPMLLLLDEPLSALDAKLRESMQVELRLLQQQLKITTILVTHDQREAMTMADTIVVMAAGKIQQVGSPIEIYREPANRFVADFIGQSNLLDADYEAGDQVRVGDHPARIGNIPQLIEPGRKVTISIRPEDIRLGPAGAIGPNQLPGQIIFVRDMGSSIEAHIACAGKQLISVSTPREWPGGHANDAVSVELPPEACRLLLE